MSVNRISTLTLSDKYLRANQTAVAPWVRPVDWLAIPELSSSEQKFVGLHAIHPDSNFLAFTAAGAYTVDWGDGSSPQNFASGATALHTYDFTNVAFDGTLTTPGYKQAIVTITPQGGQNLTSINLNVKHTQTGLQAYAGGWLDITVAGPLLTSFTASGTTVPQSLVQRARVQTAALTSAAGMFNGCSGLVTASLTNTGTVLVTLSNMFTGCPSLTTVNLNLTNAGAATNMSSMFNACTALTTVPLFDTAAVTTFTNMFNGCSSLTTVPLFNTAAVTNFSSMFTSCYSLTSSDLVNAKYAISYTGCKLSRTAIQNIIDRLGRANTQGLVLTITNNWGTSASPIVSISGTTTVNSPTVTMASTTNLVVGMQVSGTGIAATTPRAVTLTAIGGTVNLVNHQLTVGAEVSFSTVTTTTSVINNTIYFVETVPDADTFTLSATLGGAQHSINVNGSANLRYISRIVSIVPNTSVTLDTPASASGTATLAYRELITSRAFLKGWSVTG